MRGAGSAYANFFEEYRQSCLAAWAVPPAIGGLGDPVGRRHYLLALADSEDIRRCSSKLAERN